MPEPKWVIAMGGKPTGGMYRSCLRCRVDQLIPVDVYISGVRRVRRPCGSEIAGKFQESVLSESTPQLAEKLGRARMRWSKWGLWPSASLVTEDLEAGGHLPTTLGA
jgi:NADH:ubiquinone oxidoreductase subunit B-like Fe-S oxidoreductase